MNNPPTALVGFAGALLPPEEAEQQGGCSMPSIKIAPLTEKGRLGSLER